MVKQQLQKQEATLPTLQDCLPDHTGEPIKSIGAPTKCIGAPTDFIGPPTNFIGAPIKCIGGPTNYIGAPIKKTGRPVNFTGLPIKYKGCPEVDTGDSGFYSVAGKYKMRLRCSASAGQLMLSNLIPLKTK